MTEDYNYPTADSEILDLFMGQITHDLIRFISSPSNFIELMESEEFFEDAFYGLKRDALIASNILRFFRLAYGASGWHADLNLAEARDVAVGFLDERAINLNWPADVSPNRLPAGGGKLLLNLIALAATALPRGGAIYVSIDCQARAENVVLTVEVTGPEAGLRKDLRDCLTKDINVHDISHRCVYSHYTRLLIKRMGATIMVLRGAARMEVVLPI